MCVCLEQNPKSERGVKESTALSVTSERQQIVIQIPSIPLRSAQHIMCVPSYYVFVISFHLCVNNQMVICGVVIICYPW